MGRTDPDTAGTDSAGTRRVATGSGGPGRGVLVTHLTDDSDHVRAVATTARTLLGSLEWTPVVVLPPEPQVRAGTTGWADPVLGADELEEQARQEERAGVEQLRRVVDALATDVNQRHLVREDGLRPLLDLVRPDRADVAVIATPPRWAAPLHRTPAGVVLSDSTCPVMVVRGDHVA